MEDPCQDKAGRATCPGVVTEWLNPQLDTFGLAIKNVVSHCVAHGRKHELSGTDTLPADKDQGRFEQVNQCEQGLPEYGPGTAQCLYGRRVTRLRLRHQFLRR